PGPSTSHTDSLKTLVAELGLGDAVLVLGAISEDELQALYEGAAVYVYPAPEEDFGLGVIESMAKGIPGGAWNQAGPTVPAGTGGKLRPRLLADEEEGDEPQSQVEVVKPEAHPHFWAWTATLAAAAAVPRLLYMFVFSNPENPGPDGDGQATVEESKQLGGWYNEPGY